MAKPSRSKPSPGGKSSGRSSSSRSVSGKGTTKLKVKAASAVSRVAAVAKAVKVVPMRSARAAAVAVPVAKNGAPVRGRDAAIKNASFRHEPLQNRPIPEPVPTDGKPRKNQAGLTTRELEHYRDLLLDKRRELVGDMSQMEREALRSSGGSNLSTLPLHMADMGTDNYEQEFTLGLVEKDRNLLREINAALAKIQNGTYGICEGTGKPISKVRLEAQPWARFSIEYARKMEKGFIR